MSNVPSFRPRAGMPSVARMTAAAILLAQLPPPAMAGEPPSAAVADGGGADSLTLDGNHRKLKRLEYGRRRIVIARREGLVLSTSGYSVSVSGGTYWLVMDGAGESFDAKRFARTVGDSATLTRIRRVEVPNQVVAIVGAAVGTGLILGGVGSLAGAVRVHEEEVEAYDRAYDEWWEEYSAWSDNGAYGPEPEEPEEPEVDPLDPQAGMGAVLITIGTLVASIIPSVAAEKAREARRMGERYTVEEALHWAGVHNENLRRELGLTEEDVREEPPAPPKDRGIQATPVLGFGWVGLVGSF